MFAEFAQFFDNTFIPLEGANCIFSIDKIFSTFEIGKKINWRSAEYFVFNMVRSNMGGPGFKLKSNFFCLSDF